jgi:hypothetical protein
MRAASPDLLISGVSPDNPQHYLAVSGPFPLRLVVNALKRLGKHLKDFQSLPFYSLG